MGEPPIPPVAPSPQPESGSSPHWPSEQEMLPSGVDGAPPDGSGSSRCAIPLVWTDSAV
jgi:hypothetical protein